jgi:hypothetical protein
MSPREWSQLHVRIIGPPMPREDLVVTQYFLRLLDEPRGTPRRTPSPPAELKALICLAPICRRQFGEAFFATT